MASDATETRAINSIQVAQLKEDKGRGIIVCVDFEHDEDASHANEVADEVARALAYEENARKAAKIAVRYSDERLLPFIKSLCSACKKNMKEIENADAYGPTVALTAAIIMADYQEQLTVAQQRSETLEMMINHQDAQAKA